MRILSAVAAVAALLAAILTSPTPLAAQGIDVKQPEIRQALQKAEDDYRLYFARPKTPVEFWAAIEFEIDLGKYDVAALLVKELLALKPADKVDAELLKIEEERGLSTFLRLRGVQKWFKDPALNEEARKDAERLIDRLTLALEKHLSDPVRIAKFIQRLNAPTPEERAYAFLQLKRSRERAAPYLVEALKATAGTVQHESLKKAILQLEPDALTPMLEVLAAATPKDFKEVEPRLAVLELFRRKKDERAVPYLYHLTASDKYPQIVRSAARTTLAALLGVAEDKLPDARVALTNLAEQHYLHRVVYRNAVHPLPGPKELPPASFQVPFYSWDGQKLSPKAELKAAAAADRFFGMRYARAALDLDPNYRPAQIILLSLVLDSGFDGKLDQLTGKPLPKGYHDLLVGLDTDLLLATLERALSDRKPAVIVPLVRILGERAETRAIRTTTIGTSRGVARALYYPDSRVQWEAANAVLQMPPPHPPVLKARVVEILSRLAAADAKPKVLAVQVPEEKRAVFRKAIEAAGYDPLFVQDRNEVFDALRRSPAVEALLLHPAVQPVELPHLFSNLAADADAGMLPVLLLAPPERHEVLRKYTLRHPNVFLVLEAITAVPAELKTEIEQANKLTRLPRFVATLPTVRRNQVIEDAVKAKSPLPSEAERKKFAAGAIDIFFLMSQGKISGYNLQPAKEVLLDVARSKDLNAASKAVAVLASLPGADVQQRLAALVLDPDRAKLGPVAAGGLVQHVTDNGILLTPALLEDLRQVRLNPQADENVRRQIGIVLGNLPATQRRTGPQLRDFRP